MRSMFFIGFFALFWAGAMSAEAKATSTAAADRLEISGKDRGLELDRRRSVTVFDEERIQSELNRGGDLSTLLDVSAGARVLDLGGATQGKRLQIRGGSPAQSAVILDGVRLRSPFATGLDIGLIALSHLESIDLVRGGQGSAWGDGAISGALVAKSKAAGEGRLAEFAMNYGSSQRVHLDATIKPGPLLLAGSYSQSRGDFSYLSNLPGLPDEAKVRFNNDGRFGRSLARFDTDIGGGDLALIAGLALRESGIPGFETQANARAREFRGQGHARSFWRGKNIDLGLFASGLAIDYEDLHEWIPLKSKTWFSNIGADARYRGVYRGHILVLEGLAQRSDSKSTEHGEVQRSETSLVVKDEFSLFNLDVSANLLAAFMTDIGLNLMPSVSVQRRLVEQASVRVALGRSFRSPALDELYHPSQRGYSGNPELLPESAWEGELGLRWRWAENQFFDLAGFVRRLEDVILVLNRNAFEVRPENAGAAEIAGLELQSKHVVAWSSMRLGFDFSGDLLWSRLLQTQEVIPTQAMWSVSGLVFLRVPRGPSDVFECLVRGRAVAATTANLQGTLKVPTYTRIDLGFNYQWSKAVVFSLRVDNLLDRQDLQSLNKLPVPGRTFLLGVRVFDLADR